MLRCRLEETTSYLYVRVTDDAYLVRSCVLAYLNLSTNDVWITLQCRCSGDLTDEAEVAQFIERSLCIGKVLGLNPTAVYSD